MSAMAFHEKAGRSQVDSCLVLLDTFSSPRRVAAVAMLPFALSRSDSFARCRLGVLGSAGAAICLAPCGSALAIRTWARRLTQSPELGFGFCLSSSWNDFGFAFAFLRGCRNRHAAAIVQRLVYFSTHPQMMQQHRQLSCRGDNGSLLPVSSTALRQFQSPASEITIDPERSQDMLRSLHQQRPQIRIWDHLFGSV